MEAAWARFSRGFYGLRDAKRLSFRLPTTSHRLRSIAVDLTDDQVSIWRQPKVDLAIDSFLTEQIFYSSADGTKVPMMITRHRDSKLDGSNRTLLYGYGGSTFR